MLRYSPPLTLFSSYIIYWMNIIKFEFPKCLIESRLLFLSLSARITKISFVCVCAHRLYAYWNKIIIITGIQQQYTKRYTVNTSIMKNLKYMINHLISFVAVSICVVHDDARRRRKERIKPAAAAAADACLPNLKRCSSFVGSGQRHDLLMFGRMTII